MAKVTVGFSCDADKDADVLTWLERQANKSAAIRAAIRTACLQDSITLGDVLQEIGEVKRLLRNGVVLQSETAGSEAATALTPEEEHVQELLDGLGL